MYLPAPGRVLLIGVVLTLLSLGGHAAPAATPITFHVARNGDDHGPGTPQKPFATLTAARDAIRAHKRQGPLTAPVRVVIHGGTYFLAGPMVLGPEDSGTAASPITYEAAAGERPVLSGGRRITGWHEATVEGKPLWAAELPAVASGDKYFHQLWVNGERRPRARYPKEGFLRIAGLPGVNKTTPQTPGQDRFQFAPGDLKAWHNLQDVDVVVLHLWVGVRLRVESVDEREHLVTFAHRSRRRLTESNEPARYWVENALELLDTPGEWYLDRKTGHLTYWPKPGEKMTEAEVIAPALPALIRLEGHPEKNESVAYVTFRGLTLAHTETWPPRSDPVDLQAAATVPGAVQAEGARHCTIESCTLSHLGGYGVHFGRGCSDNRIAGCELSDLGGGGIKIGEIALRDDVSQQTHDNVVTDNHIHDGGQVFPQAVGVWIGQSYANRVAHNHIHGLYYTGISSGWTWGYGKALAHDNVIEFNHVHDLGKGWLSDMGGFYSLGMQPGTVVRSNVFHDITGYRYGGWGIYFDEGSKDIVAENNLVYRTTHGGFHQHYGKENVVRNNVFAFGRDAQLRRTRAEPHRSFTLEHNIVYYDNGKLLDGTWDDGQFIVDNNLYWRTDGGAITFGSLTWEQWRAKGHDQHSLIADPLFLDAAKADFRLKEGSPVEKIGFKPLDLSGVGPRPSGR